MLNLFGAKKQSSKKEVSKILNGILEKGKFSLSFQISEKEGGYFCGYFRRGRGLA